MSQTKFFICMTLVLSFAVNLNAAVILDLIEPPDDPITDLTGGFVTGSGLLIIPGSEIFVGRVGAGNLAQSATYTGLNIISSMDDPTISQADGILLTTGQADTPLENTEVDFTGTTGTGSDVDLSTILAASALSSITVDTNSFSFDFTVPAGITSVELDFVFASDEFPDQPITDVFGIFVDGTNFAFFQDGSLVSFVSGINSTITSMTTAD